MQKAIAKENLLQNVRDMGKVLGKLLSEKVADLPLVGDVRGRGLFWAVEFMLDGPNGIPFPQEAKFCDKVVNIALEKGLNILGNLGVTGSVYVEHVIVCPPYIVNSEELDSITTILAESIKEATLGLGPWIRPSVGGAPKTNGQVSGKVNGATNGH